MKLPEAVVVERDAKMFELQRRGFTVPQIAAACKVSETTVYNGCKRVMTRIQKRQAVDWSHEMRLDKERLDEMLSNVLPMTRPKKMAVEGEEDIVIPPSLDAMNTALKIFDRRAKMGGYDNLSIDINVNGGGSGSGAPSLEGEKKTTEVSPVQEVKGLLKTMAEAGVLDESLSAVIQQMMGEAESDIIEAEVVETEPLAITAHDPSLDEDGPPAFVDDYDDEDLDAGPWSPDGE